ncbi:MULTISPECIES: tryptophan synthase subunit alpha [unclassified Microbacterium]|uniref:tryptophan synthase subunit alpha n=1 Tax=unclassified Microbacterium TaxID=2609290 RepID=UPI000CFC1C08|nr:tryptophan synthase subunit alpha [Microbacterium sp. MYb64]PRB03206.1 tryptophan synthase subunit alpha [Microbacterium sp. MYb64]
MTESPTRRASLEVLRAEAADELAVLVQERLLGGEDPWAFMEELPSVDELVVFLLRADEIVESGGVRPDEAGNFDVLRRIALDYPELTPIVWGLLGDGPKYRRWDLLADDARP